MGTEAIQYPKLETTPESFNRTTDQHLAVYSRDEYYSSGTQSCPTLCDPMNRSTPGASVLHSFPEFAQTHVHWVSVVNTTDQ